MEEILSQLKAGIVTEKDAFVSAIRERKNTLDGYLVSLASVLSKIDEVSSKHKTDVDALLSQKAGLEKTIGDLNEKHGFTMRVHAQDMAKKDATIAQKNQAVADLEAKHKRLDGQIVGLMTEHDQLEEQTTSLRAQETQLTRSVSGLMPQEAELKAKMEEHTQKSAQALQDETATRKRIADLNTEEAILLARKSK